MDRLYMGEEYRKTTRFKTITGCILQESRFAGTLQARFYSAAPKYGFNASL